MARERAARGVARYALITMLILFARTVVWVLDGVLTEPAEIRLLALGMFVFGGVCLWQILEFKQYARRFFILLCVTTWSWALLSLLSSYGEPVPEYSHFAAAEYLLFVAWVVVSLLFVAYLVQPHVRQLFTAKPANAYQRALAVLLLGQLFYFGATRPHVLDENVATLKLGPMPQPARVAHFQRECESQESGRLPAAATLKQGPLASYCRCDSEVLVRHCPAETSSRRECLEHLAGTLLSDSDGVLSLIADQEACVAENFPDDSQAIFQDRRRRVEKTIIRRLALSLPMDRVVGGEPAQRRFLHCMTVSLLSRCEDPRLSSTLQCLERAPVESRVDAVKKRCLGMARARSGEYEKKLAKLSETSELKARHRLAEELVALGPERAEGYLHRGQTAFELGTVPAAVEDFTIVLNISDFAYTRLQALEGRRKAYEKLGNRELALSDAREGCLLGSAPSCEAAGTAETVLSLSLGGDETARRVANAILTNEGREPIAVPEKLARVAAETAKADRATEKALLPEGERLTAADEKKKSARSQARSDEKTGSSDSHNTAKTPDTPPPTPAKTAEKGTAPAPSPEVAAWEELVQIADIARRTGDWEKAGQKLEEAHALARKAGAALEARQAARVALLAVAREDWKQAGEMSRKAIEGWRHIPDGERAELVRAVGAVTNSLQARQRWKESESLLLPLWAAASRSESLLIKDVNLLLAVLYNARGRARELEPYFIREVEVFEKRFGAQDPRGDASRSQLSNFYQEQGKPAKAAAVLGPASAGLDLTRKPGPSE